ncbi:hypothetical protein Y032_0017g3359 [Ancylostoma ceylanicum]|uniref:Uncharacterized protein n=1 Tax=Ancylostoma ceylanicum TaxID=53326 RepID=A0A016V616_9BILA|nr:hypothetical protein Y032_0017g3359 [Ancylostoma ceylanicum]
MLIKSRVPRKAREDHYIRITIYTGAIVHVEYSTLHRRRRGCIIRGCNKTTLIGASEPLVTPTCLTRTAHTALSTNRPCVMGLTSFEFEQMGVAGGPNTPTRVALLRPFFTDGGTHPVAGDCETGAH